MKRLCDWLFLLLEIISQLLAFALESSQSKKNKTFNLTYRTGKFKLHITALNSIAPFAKYKIWVKPAGEMPFLYGNHVLKAHLGRITEDTPEHQGVVVLSMQDVPLGFGVTARSTVDARNLAVTGIVIFHQADVGEYLRDEDSLS